MSFYVRKRRPPLINIVSLIDILAILLIFFIVTTTFKKRRNQLQIALPQSATAAEAQNAEVPVMVSVDDKSRIYLGDVEVSKEDLSAAVRALLAKKPDEQIGLEVHKEVPFQVVVSILDALKEAGVENLPAFTEKPE